MVLVASMARISQRVTAVNSLATIGAFQLTIEAFFAYNGKVCRINT